MKYCDCDILKKRILDHKKYPNQKKMLIKDVINIVHASELVYGYRTCVCRDCINWDTDWQPRMSEDYHYCPMVDFVTKDTFYCAYAERKKL